MLWYRSFWVNWTCRWQICKLKVTVDLWYTKKVNTCLLPSVTWTAWKWLWQMSVQPVQGTWNCNAELDNIKSSVGGMRWFWYLATFNVFFCKASNPEVYTVNRASTGVNRFTFLRKMCILTNFSILRLIIGY